MELVEEVVQKTRYSDIELKEFEDIILKKINSTKEDLRESKEAMRNNNDGGINVDDGALTLEKESQNYLAVRQQEFISKLEAALVRIRNKTYGICKETGKLIPAGRLRAVPHTTLCKEIKDKAA